MEGSESRALLSGFRILVAYPVHEVIYIYIYIYIYTQNQVPVGFNVLQIVVPSWQGEGNMPGYAWSIQG